MVVYGKQFAILAELDKNVLHMMHLNFFYFFKNSWF